MLFMGIRQLAANSSAYNLGSDLSLVKIVSDGFESRRARHNSYSKIYF